MKAAEPTFRTPGEAREHLWARKNTDPVAMVVTVGSGSNTRFIARSFANEREATAWARSIPRVRHTEVHRRAAARPGAAQRKLTVSDAVNEIIRLYRPSRTI